MDTPGAQPEKRKQTPVEDQVEADHIVDPVKLQMLMQQLQDNQNLGMGIVGGLIGAVVGASVWAAITYFTGWQIGFMAIGVGFLVGWLIRTLGQGITKTFGIVGAVLSLFGCLLGNYLTACVYIAEMNGMGLFEVLVQIDMATAIQIMGETFSPMDLLFYGIALYYGYRYSFRPLTEDELKTVLKPA